MISYDYIGPCRNVKNSSVNINILVRIFSTFKFSGIVAGDMARQDICKPDQEGQARRNGSDFGKFKAATSAIQ